MLRQMARTQQRMWMIKQHRAQGGLCPLCGLEIDLKIPREGVIDHNHITGECRGVLHRSCNAAEGKVRRAVVCWGSKTSEEASVVAFIVNLAKYLQSPGLGIIYAQHKTAEDKAKAAKAKAQRARASTIAKRKVRRLRKFNTSEEPQ